MPPKPLISVLLSFQNQQDEAKASLNALFKLETIPFELIIVDDASTDGIHQYLPDSTPRGDVIFIEHSQPAGCGNCLNEALQQAASKIIWMPSSIRSIDEKAFQKSIATLRNGSSPCLIHASVLPASLSEWPEFIRKGRFPDNGNMLWNTNYISARDYFINPFLNRYHGLEWLIRLGMDTLESGNNFFKPLQADNKHRPSPSGQKELFFALMRRPGTTAGEYPKIAKHLADIRMNQEQEDAAEDDDIQLLKKAVKLKMKGQLSASLEYVEQMLKRKPDNLEAKRLKIKLLESKRRYVEAAELKHEMQRADKYEHVYPEFSGKKVKTSLIIPTALYGKPALENCLLSVDQHCSPAKTELIIIDNASLDDTYEYLQELQKKEFFNCQVITNQQNKGFAASANQALELANGKYACIMHNDVWLQNPVVDQLEKLMDKRPDFALTAPLADNTLNQDQTVTEQEDSDEVLVEADYLDSFFMMIRTACGMRMDETYGPAFFDDIDFCYEARRKGYKVGIARNTQVSHHYGTTTLSLGLDTNTRQYWKNAAYFNDKWDIRLLSDEALQNKTGLEQLRLLDEWVNPLYPEPVFQKKFEELFTEELKTEILTSSYDQEVNRQLIHLMMVMEKRDVMRRLEERLEDTELPAKFVYELVRFYFNHNVYSRCLHYLNRLSDNQESVKSELYRLAILIDEKKMAEAIPLLTSLLDKIPSNPALYKLAGDIHSFEGDLNEAASFHKLAEQINPFDFGEKQMRLNV
jgi:GT2 family glycosyltransferase